MDWRDFRHKNKHVSDDNNFEVSSSNRYEIKRQSEGYFRSSYKENWNSEIQQIELSLKAYPITKTCYKLNNWTIIDEPQKFVDSHLDTLKANNGNPTYQPYLTRLQLFVKLLSESIK